MYGQANSREKNINAGLFLFSDGGKITTFYQKSSHKIIKIPCDFWAFLLNCHYST
jgi:hypothetical protein